MGYSDCPKYSYIYFIKLDMKKIISLQTKKVFNRLSLLMATLVLSLYSFAQEKKVDIDINTKSENDNFFMQPWVWVLGGAVFILLLVALLKSGKKD